MVYPLFRSRVFLFSAVALTVLVSTGAEAGFQWKGPVTPPAPPPAAAAPAAESSDMQGLEPVITWDGSSGAMPAVKTGQVEQTPVAAPGSMPGSMPPAADAGDVVEGFGAQLPLVIALQQVAPAGYRVSFAPGVSPGTTVSWTGGKPWKQVLADTLAPVGLSYKIEDSTVVVTRADAAPQKQAEMPARPADAAPETAAAETAPLPLTQPQENRVLIGRASETGTKVAAAEPAPQPPKVDIRREKPESFLERLGFRHHEDSAQDAWGHVDATSVAPQAAAKPDAGKPDAGNADAGKAGVAGPKVETAVGDEALPPPMPITPQADSAEKVSVPASAPVETTAQTAVTPAWHGAKGQTLRAVLKDWSATAGVEMYWSVDYDYKLDNDVAFTGTYDEAVNGILEKFAAAKPQPYGQLHQASDGPRVLVIKTYGLSG